MPSYIIGPDNSIFHPATAGLWDPGATPPNTLTIAPGGFIISQSDDALALGGNWSITVNGSLLSTTSLPKSAIFFWAPSLTTASTVKIGSEGALEGAFGIFSHHRLNVTNQGYIQASGAVDSAGIALFSDADGDSKIDNSGVIRGAVFGIHLFADVTGTHTIINKGSIFASLASIAVDPATISVEKVTNAGFMSSGVGLGLGNDTLMNSGQMRGPIIMGSAGFFSPDDDALVNSGDIHGVVVFGKGSDSLANSGLLEDFVTFEDGGDRIENSGTLAKQITFAASGAGNTLLNSGTIKEGVTGGSGTDKVANTGTIEGTVRLLGGADEYAGGSGRDVVEDGDGADVVSLGSGDDTYYAVGHAGADGFDTIDGGGGRDYYSGTGAFHSLVINLDTSAHSAAGGDLVAGSTAYGTEVSNDAGGTVFRDKITGFESAEGGAAADLIFGSAVANNLYGRDGSDRMLGYGGIDLINGEGGNDNITGGLGADELYGGSGFDTFRYETLKDSGITKATRDRLADFEIGIDDIDLSAIDANTLLAGDQAFTWIGTNASFSAAGQLRAYWTVNGQIVDGDVNGDKKPDFSISLPGLGHGSVLSAGDFIL